MITLLRGSVSRRCSRQLFTNAHEPTDSLVAGSIALEDAASSRTGPGFSALWASTHLEIRPSSDPVEEEQSEQRAQESGGQRRSLPLEHDGGQLRARTAKG